MKDYIEERAIGIANYIIDNNATVRQTAKAYGVSKSTVHMVVTKQNGFCGESNKVSMVRAYRRIGISYMPSAPLKDVPFPTARIAVLYPL